MRPPKYFFIYIMTNRSGTFYTGMSTDLLVRAVKHRQKWYPNAFAAKYRIDRVVWYEVTESAEAAIQREKTVKRMLRSEKIALIEGMNPKWRDLSEEWLGRSAPPQATREGGLPRPWLPGKDVRSL